LIAKGCFVICYKELVGIRKGLKLEQTHMHTHAHTNTHKHTQTYNHTPRHTTQNLQFHTPGCMGRRAFKEH
jgi:hypothetical protein